MLPENKYAIHNTLLIEYTSDEYAMFLYYVIMISTLIHFMFSYTLCFKRSPL